MSRWRFEQVSRQKVADVRLAEKLHKSTGTSLAKTRAIIAETPDWQELRQRARQIKLHTLTHLDQYLRQFIRAAEANGATVSWAATGEEACRQVVDVAGRHGVTRVVKAKSMTGEEVEINHALQEAGIEPVETDFGEMVCQLSGEPPSHVTAPIIQWSIEEVAALLKAHGIVDELPPELVEAQVDRPGGGQSAGASLDHHDDLRRLAAAAKLVAAARRALRPKFLSAEMGLTGANFAVAESGTLVLVENEANIRLSTTLPPVHVAIVGIEKLIPHLADLGTFLSLLPVAATGQRQSAYVSLIHRPYRELHVVLLDNGRSRLLADREHYDLLSCIRCGACMNVCPVYRHVSGHAYNSVYPGPIGAVLTPHLMWHRFPTGAAPVSNQCDTGFRDTGFRGAGFQPVQPGSRGTGFQPVQSSTAGLKGGDGFLDLPFASSLCGACSEICPVGIPLDERLLQWRERIVSMRHRPIGERIGFRLWAYLMRHPALYRAARPWADWIDAVAGLFRPVRRWRSTRDLPPAAEETFAEWWKKNRDAGQD